MKIRKRFLATALSAVIGFGVVFSGIGMTASAMGREYTVNGVTEIGTSVIHNASSSKGNGFSTEDFEGRVSVGLEGKFRAGSGLPIEMYITSLKSDFEGVLRVIIPGSDYSGRGAVAYERDIMLAKGQEQVITQTISNATGISGIKIEIEDSKGNSLLTKNITMSNYSNSTALVGILSDDYTAYSYLSAKAIQLSKFDDMTEILELKADTLPDQASGLGLLSYMVIDNYDTSQLSSDQMTAIENWVKDGGVLIIGTGSEYKKTLSGIPGDFVSGNITEGKAGTLTPVLQKNSQLYANSSYIKTMEYTSSQGLVNISLNGGSVLNDVFNEEGLVFAKDYGQGRIVMTAFNLGMEPISSYAGRDVLAESLLNMAGKGSPANHMYNVNYGSEYNYYGGSSTDMLRYLMEASVPNTRLLTILLIAFLLTIGPGLYFILKKKDKLELLWFLIPCVSVGFTLVIFLVTADLRINSPVLASVTNNHYEEAHEGEDGTNSSSVDMGIMIPKAGNSSFNLNGDLVGLQYTNESGWYYYDNGTPNTYDVAIKESASGYGVRFVTNSTFVNRTMEADVRTVSTNPGFEVDLKRTYSSVEGSVKNISGYDFDYVVVLSGSRVVFGGKLVDGETFTFVPADNIAFYESSSLDYQRLMDNGQISDTRRIGRAVRVISSWLSQYNTYGYTSANDEIQVLGYVDSYTADYVVNEKVKEHNTAVFTYTAHVADDEYENSVSLDLYSYYAGTYGDWDTDGQLYSTMAICPFDLSSAYIDSIYALYKEDGSMYGDTSQTKIYALNVETGNYDLLFGNNSSTEKFENGKCPYLSKEGMITLKFTCPYPYEDYSPRIQVIGGGAAYAGN